MGISVSLGDYEPEKLKEPWEKHQFRDTSRAYYTQSVNKMVNKLSHCLTALTSLELHECYTDPDEKKNETENTVPKINYLSAVTIYMNNCGKIIGGERILTHFKVITTGKENGLKDVVYKLDKSYPIKKKKENCVDGKELHNHIIKNKTIQFRNGNFYVIKTFHKYIKEASICNRRTDVNYTNMKVTKSRKELSDLLTNMSIAGATIGFIEGTGAEVLKKGLDCFFYAIGLESKFEAIDNLYPLNGPVHIDKLTTHKYYEAVQGGDLDFYQKEISHKQRKSSKEDGTDILDKLETFGLIVKK
ncbi:hypothetical protein KHA90_09090 [Flavobacterium psychroterrae]|uniref:Uncharacterized protein n=1 Tax=Flavobacterium psychroterrae TaxID=2133767 RepID=A0ABS5PA35_9FLAO|nr:hypothetical protein [Flavobacterium psychroterrae]MBS7231180.1 hypothetical protein [Flavobacterium psychroterrae]